MSMSSRFRCWKGTAIGAALSLAVLLGQSGGPAEAQTVMKLASATINDVQHEWQKTFAQELAERVGDKVKVEIYPASQLGSIPRMVEGVLFGTIESFISPTAFLVGTEPKLQVLDAPGLFDSPEHVGRVIHDPAYRDHLETLALDKDLRIIGVIFNSPFLVLTKDPTPKLDDLAGKKIRTFASPLQIEPMKAIGANPLPLPLTEVVPALQSGNIDGMLAGMPILTAFRYYDVAKYVTDLSFSQIVSINVINETWFQSQPEEVRNAIREAGRAAEEAVLQWGIDNLERSNGAWVENGGEILALSEEDRARMLSVFREVGERILTEDPEVAEEYTLLTKVVDEKR